MTVRRSGVWLSSRLGPSIDPPSHARPPIARSRPELTRLTKSTSYVVSLVSSGRDLAMGGRAWDGGSMLGPSLEESHMPDLLTVIPVAWGCGGLNCGCWLARHDS